MYRLPCSRPESNEYASSKGVLVISASGNGALDMRDEKDLVFVPVGLGTGLAVSATGPAGYYYGEDNYERLLATRIMAMVMSIWLGLVVILNFRVIWTWSLVLPTPLMCIPGLQAQVWRLRLSWCCSSHQRSTP